MLILAAVAMPEASLQGEFLVSRFSFLVGPDRAHLTRNEKRGTVFSSQIRKQEALAAGCILGIRRHHFLDQKDAAFTLDAEDAAAAWDKKAVRDMIAKLLREQGYEFVFTLLPAAGTHGEHKAATLLALEAAQSLPEELRPLVLGIEAGASNEKPPEFFMLRGYAITQVGADVHEFRRSQPFGSRDALNYEIIAKRVIAAHKSQGLFQMDAGRHDVERFWRFEVSGGHSPEPARKLFDQLQQVAASAARQVAGIHP